jgi:phospholipid/cholesterol/gamma-HCH transport system substrate-binding protein
MTVARAAAVGGIALVAILTVWLLLLRGPGGHEYTLIFVNAGQLVKGDTVQVGGRPVGSVESISLTRDNQAAVKVSVQAPYAPLHEGTQAVVRLTSLSGIANRYVGLTPGPSTNPKISDGATLGTDKTTTPVDLDEVFNTLDPKTRKSLQDFFRFSATQFHGKEEQQRLAYRYLNPALSTSSHLFNELNRDQPRLERFLIDSANLVTDLAQKRDDLAALVGNLNSTFRALGNQRAALAESISLLPGFMRQANTTFVDLRSALDDVDPLVNASKPVAPKLNRLLLQLRPFAHDARPTVRDLSRIVFQPGKDNDLFNLEHTFPPVTQAALDTKTRSIDFGGGPRSVGRVPGAFPTTVPALKNSTPLIAFGRPYTPDLMGWFDDFSTTGAVDAAGGYSRVLTIFNAFDALAATPVTVDLPDRAAEFTKSARTKQYKRCPGGAEVRASDGSNVLSLSQQKELDCTEHARASGIYPTNQPGPQSQDPVQP